MNKALSMPRRSPDGDPAGGTPSPEINPKIQKTALLPESDIQLAELGVYAAGVWQQNPWLTLRFITQTDFAITAARYLQAVQDRVSAGAERPSMAAQLLTLDARINESLYRVKALVTDKYDRKAAPAYFAKMGITRENDSFILPRERSKRAAALVQLVQGLVDEGFVTTATTYPYGTGYWQPIATEYAQLVKELTDHTGAISDAVGEKDTLREVVATGLRALAKVLDGNFPAAKEYKAQLRAWGFQRESY